MYRTMTWLILAHLLVTKYKQKLTICFIFIDDVPKIPFIFIFKVGTINASILILIQSSNSNGKLKAAQLPLLFLFW